MPGERIVQATDIERYRQAMTELGGKATLEQLAALGSRLRGRMPDRA